MGLKGMSSYGIRGRRLYVTLIAMMCMSVIFWASERTPQITTLHSPQERMKRVSHDGHFDYPTDDVIPQMDRGLLKKPKLESRNGITVDGLAMGPADSVMPSSRLESKEYRKLKSASAGKKECNYAKGEWVADDRRPLYSGAECKQWLSEMWACRLTQRTDFSFEAFRWQPDYCEMPEFESSTFFKRMKGKTMAFVGDSLGRQQFQSLMCMVTGGKLDTEVEDVGEEYGFAMTPGSARPSGWAYRFPTTNTTILYHWSATLCELEPLNVSDPMTSVAMHLDRPAAFLQQYLHKLDVLVLNTGHHWNRGKLNGNRWEMFAEGSPIEDRYLKMIGNAKNFTVHSVVRWLDNQLPRHPHIKAFFRSISPRHFFNGEWNTGGSCDNTSPLAHGSRVSHKKSVDLLAASAVQGTNVKLLDVTALSQLRDEGHISKYSLKSSSGVHDCLHWCLPGIPDAWNEILYAQL